MFKLLIKKALGMLNLPACSKGASLKLASRALTKALKPSPVQGCLEGITGTGGNGAFYIKHTLNQFKHLGLDRQCAVQFARKLHARSIMYANKLKPFGTPSTQACQNWISSPADDVARMSQNSRLELEKWHSNLLDSLRALPNVSPTTLSHFDAFLQSQEASLPLALRAVKVWVFLARYVLHPEHAFTTHQRLLQAVYAQWPSSSLGPYPVWVPSAEDIQRHNITDFLSHFQVSMLRFTLDQINAFTKFSGEAASRARQMDACSKAYHASARHSLLHSQGSVKCMLVQALQLLQPLPAAACCIYIFGSTND
eukprot:586368-Pelagomonas_calceolata.AAC.7